MGRAEQTDQAQLAERSWPAELVELVEDRHRWLLEQLAEHRRLTTNETAAELGVSVDTIRRDLRLLHDRGLLRRVHGGAVPVSAIPGSFRGRSSASSEGRTALAATTVDRFRSGDLIGLDAGSTNVEIASQIPQTLEITIVTNNPAAATALADHRSASVILLGGNVDLRWMATTGPETVDGWRGYRLDLLVLGACAFDPDRGAATRSQHEVATKRAMIAAAAETVLPIQTEKLGTTAPFHVADAAEIDSLIVEPSTDKSMIKRCRAAGIAVNQA